MSSSVTEALVRLTRCDFVESCQLPAVYEFERAPGLGWIPLCETHARICQNALPSGTLRRLTSATEAR